MNKGFANDYIEVAERLATFKRLYPEGSLQSEIVSIDAERVIVRALAYRTPDDARPGVGHAWEVIPGRTPYTKGSELMVCETSAWGRALAGLGIETKRGIATADEVRAAESRRAPEPLAESRHVEAIRLVVGNLRAIGDDKASVEGIEAKEGKTLDKLTAARAEALFAKLQERYQRLGDELDKEAA